MLDPEKKTFLHLFTCYLRAKFDPYLSKSTTQKNIEIEHFVNF